MLVRTVDTVLTWDSAAESHATSIWLVSRSFDFASLADIRSAMDELIDKVTVNAEIVGVDDWLRLGGLAVRAHGDMKCQAVTDVVCAKQRDYGPSNILKFSFYGIVVRLNDKVSRLENLLSSGKEASFESVNDTYCDIVGYCIIGMLLASGGFHLPMREVDK